MKIERIYREVCAVYIVSEYGKSVACCHARFDDFGGQVRAFAIPGGSEEIMLDLSMKQSMKVFEMTRGMVTDLASL